MIYCQYTSKQERGLLEHSERVKQGRIGGRIRKYP